MPDTANLSYLNHANPFRIPLLFTLTSTSLFISTAVFCFSMVNAQGTDSFFSVPAVYAITFLYHLTILIIEHRKPQGDKQGDVIPLYSTSSTMASIIICGILLGLWLACLAVLVLVAVLFLEGNKPLRLAQRGNAIMVWVMIVQCVLIAVESVILTAIVVRSSFERKHGRGRSWKGIPIAYNNTVLESNLVIR